MTRRTKSSPELRERAAAATPTEVEGALHLSPAQLAARWGIHVGTLRNWRSAKRGPPFVKLGVRASYPLAGVEAWEREHAGELRSRPAT